VPSRGQPVRVRWDRLGRIGLLIVLLVVAGLYVKQGLSLLSTRAQAQQQLSIVHRLTRQNAQLARQRAALNDPVTIERDARALGMVRTGERPYVVTGLPNH
jgi:cell division protein FtsB